MSQSRWQQIEEIFQSALDVSPAERSDFVSARCGQDAALRSEVEKLLADYESADSFIESPVWTSSDFLNSSAKRNLASSLGEDAGDEAAAIENPLIGQQIGAYRLVREIGRGGMGAVYLGTRADGSFRQKVAVKLIKRGMDTDFILKRFRQERQILATLNHSFIARLLDGGTTDDDLPYFVMEYIEGEPLYRYCDEQKLSINERLKLFGQICEAIDFAHQNQVIHRDIKPPNILITKDGVPKLLDFGIAKVLNPEFGLDTVDPTATAMRLMTPEYASPEQVCGGEITPASDIYSMGVLLYELLTGHRPYKFSSRAAHEIARVICEEAPEPLGAGIAREDNLLPSSASKATTLADVCTSRGAANIEDLRRDLAGDIERIILKCLRKEPATRYQNAAELAEDIARYLNGKPVEAENYFLNSAQISPAGTSGEKSLAVLPLRILNPAASAADDQDFLSIGLTDALITRLSNVRRFVVRPTSSVLPYNKKQTDAFQAGRDLTVDFVVDGNVRRVGKRIRVTAQLLSVKENSMQWAQSFDEDFTDVLALEDSISERVTKSLLPLLTGEEERRLKKRGTNEPRAYESYLRGRFHFSTFTEDGFAKSIVAYTEAIAHDAEYALAYAGIADYYNWLAVFGVLPAQECFRAAIEAATKAVEIDPELSEAHAALGFAAVGGQYDWTQGEISCRRALELNPNNSTAHVWYSIQLFMEGRFEEGFRHAERGIEIDPVSPFNRHNLAWGLYFAGRFDESVGQYRRLVERTDSQYPLAFYGLSWGLRIDGKFDEAVKAIERALELDPDSAFLLTCYGQTLAAAGKRAEASEILAKLEKLSEHRHISAYHIAIIHTFLGAEDKALAALEKSFEERDSWIAWTGVEPVFDSLRDDTRFMNLLERTGNPIFNREKTLLVRQRAEITAANEIQTTDADTDVSEVKPISEIAPAYGFPKWAIAAALTAFVGIAFFATRDGWYNGWRQNAETLLSRKSAADSPANAARHLLSIAVLPFATAGAKTDDQQYLGVGTADLVTSKLGQISEINLRSASSVRRYLKTDKSPVEIGRELAVDYVVSGIVERRENAVEAKLEMIEIESGRVVWSEIFDEPDSDLFALQDSISELIVKSLSLRLTTAEKQKLARHFTENNKAQQLYVAGRFNFGKRTVEGLRAAISLFEQAIAVDPNFALAYTGLADCQALLNWYQEPQPPDAWSNAKAAAAKAVQLDDNLAEAHASLAFIKFHFERDYAGAENEFRRAVNLKPNYATAHQWYAFMLSAQARHAEAVAVMRRAEELEPRSAVITNAVANVLFLARLYDESIAQAKRSLEIDPSSVGAHVILRWNYEKKAAADEALAVYEKEVAFAGDTPTSRAKRAHVFAAVGKKDEARQILDRLATNNQIEQITPYEIAVIYALLNDKDESFEYLEKARAAHAVGFSFVRVDPLLDNLRGDERFENLLK